MPGGKSIYIERIFSYNCPNPTVCLDLLEKIDEELSLETELIAEFKHNKLVFKVIGLEPNVQSSINKIREYIESYMNTKRLNPRKGIRADDLAKILRKTVPIDVLAEVLRYSLKVDPREYMATLYVDLDLDTVIEYAKHVAAAMEKLPHGRYPYSLRKLLVAASSLLSVHIDELVTLLKDKSIISEELELKMPWQEALKILMQQFSEHGESL
ncbi:MAG: DUF2067 domain-containing protein [Ignisphaera sp.]|nr:DUF2067 domain-containing protein [Ignisphaera sp.]MCX8168454.1 DUF2067 domain-containing protein [Ignisphaera sp.]MDW8085106.1 DUF2067 family protein [Ignisphaera sp.]